VTESRAVIRGAREAPAPGPLGALRERASTVLPGAYAWVTTVALPAVQPSTPRLARGAALLAVLALVAAPWFVRERPWLARALGVYAFIGCSLLTWMLLGAQPLASRTDPFLAALGGIAFMLYALGWGSLRRRGAVPEDGPDILPGAPLVARARQSAVVPVLFGVIVVSSLVPTFLAFRVHDTERGLFAHAVAVLVAILTITAGSRVVLGLGQRRAMPPPGERSNAAAVPLALVALAFGLGFLWLVVR